MRSARCKNRSTFWNHGWRRETPWRRNDSQRNAQKFCLHTQATARSGCRNSSVELPRVDSVWKIAPALISGNTVIFKPATLTPFTGARVIQVFEQAGIPAGVLNMIVGSGSQVGDELLQHPDVRAISFTGSTK